MTCTALVLAAAVLAACSDRGPTQPEPRQATRVISVAGGAGQEGEVGTELPEPLVVEVRTTDGVPVPGVAVAWSGAGTATPAASVTDAQGRASTRWTLPTAAGAVEVVAQVPGTQLSTRMGVHARPGAPVRLATHSDSVAMYFYASGLTVGAAVLDRYGNPLSGVPVIWTSLDPQVAGVEGSGEAARIVPVAPGRARVVARLGALADTMAARVLHDIVFLEVTPFRLRAMVGDSIPFSVIGVGPAYIVRQASVTWSLEGSAISLVPTGDSRAAGLALAPGRVVVTATLSWEPRRSASVVIEVVASSDWAQLSAGEIHNCGVTAGGGTFCWGQNFNDFTGTGAADRCFGVECGSTPMPVRGGLPLASVASGSFTTCGLAADGRAFCWGGNLFGQMGNGSSTNLTVRSPEPVTGGHRFTSLALGSTHTCGLDTEGRAYCWGGNQSGEVGVPGAPVMANPVPLPVSGGLTFRRLQAAGSRTCGITTAGETYCWGEYIGTAPTRVQGPEFAAITLSRQHFCALTPTGEAYCWGLGHAGELGQGGTTLTQELAPRPVLGGRRFVSIAAGERYTCAVDEQGAAWCWGGDRDGVLGNGGADAPTGTPTRVAGGHVFRSVTAGRDHACALAADGSAFCWGGGYVGTLGNGTRAENSVPVRVSIP